MAPTGNSGSRRATKSIKEHLVPITRSPDSPDHPINPITEYTRSPRSPDHPITRSPTVGRRRSVIVEVLSMLVMTLVAVSSRSLSRSRSRVTAENAVVRRRSRSRIAKESRLTIMTGLKTVSNGIFTFLHPL